MIISSVALRRDLLLLGQAAMPAVWSAISALQSRSCSTERTQDEQRGSGRAARRLYHEGSANLRH